MKNFVVVEETDNIYFVQGGILETLFLTNFYLFMLMLKCFTDLICLYISGFVFGALIMSLIRVASNYLFGIMKNFPRVHVYGRLMEKCVSSKDSSHAEPAMSFWKKNSKTVPGW